MYNIKTIYAIKEKNIKSKEYQLCYWKHFDYSILENVLYHKKSGRGNNKTYNEAIIMFDTETSKKINGECENHVVAWTISIRAFHQNICTLYGSRPSQLVKCMKKIHETMHGEDTYFFAHNLAYDWTFCRKFLMKRFGMPETQLNTKPHYPISIKFQNGIILRDSLIIAQRSLDKWSKDMAVEHQKACGKWDYNKLRKQEDIPLYSDDELEYIEHDTLAGVECLDALMTSLGKSVYSIPYTATGIPRQEVRMLGRDNNARQNFLRVVPTYEQYRMLERCFHGGFTHANRHLVECTIDWDIVKAFDFSSSYPYCLLAYKYPAERYAQRHERYDIADICQNAFDYSYMFTFRAFNIELKDPLFPMPPLQFSKCTKCVNHILDNGRILAADYVEINLLEMDALVISKYYKWSSHDCINVQVAVKEYLPRWFTDYIYGLYQAKTQLKGAGDPVLYAIKKANLNAASFGMTVQHCIQEDIVEVYKSGEYMYADIEPEDVYDKYVKNPNSILPYFWGVETTSIAFYNLFQLGECCETWVYSDTDSCYGIGWDVSKVLKYNENCKQRLLDNGYGAVLHNGREYWLGIAETSDEDEYTEFRVMGAKRYCGRCKADGELHLTVAGVPKKGVISLKNDINNFTKGLVFHGSQSGKLLHTYYYVDSIYHDKDGNETGDSIDLNPCDYLLDSVKCYDFDSIFYEEVTIRLYEEE